MVEYTKGKSEIERSPLDLADYAINIGRIRGESEPIEDNSDLAGGREGREGPELHLYLYQSSQLFRADWYSRRVFYCQLYSFERV